MTRSILPRVLKVSYSKKRMIKVLESNIKIQGLFSTHEKNVFICVSEGQNEYYTFLNDNEETVITCDEERKGKTNTNEPKTFNSFELLGSYDIGGENYHRTIYMPGNMRLDKTKGLNDCINRSSIRIPS